MDDLLHSLRLRRNRAERARAAYTQQLRRYVSHTMAAALERGYQRLPSRRVAGDGNEVHRRLQRQEIFAFYSALRVAAQDQVYQVVAGPIERDRDRLHVEAQRLAQSQALGSLTLDARLAVPRSVSALDIHLMPGSYTREEGNDDLTAGAVYDNRLQITSMGLMGRNLDGIGTTAAQYLQRKHPAFAARRVLDLGCTIGHNTGPWKDLWPQADVHAIDVAAPCLRYALARARAQGRAIHFHQMDATELQFPDSSFDVVFSSMFLHELPRHDLDRVFREARRVLRPGGLMLHMELPPNKSLRPFEQFYLDWDAFYNNEPYYQVYRIRDPRELCRAAGFPASGFFEWVLAPESDAPSSRTADSASVGRLAQGVRWYYFGSWA